MPTVSYDGQSFLIDGRRIWLVSGAIHYTRTPRGLWRSRIRAAKQAGLNCIETYVFWNVHEPRPGVFNFEGDADLRAFVKLIAEENLCCILRPGPYVCAEWDFGGLPAWLHRVEGIKLREANGPFLSACARYLGAVMEQVKDLQVTHSPVGRQPAGTPPPPIVMVQAENEWFCHNPAQGETYLREIVRYLRESGCEVPINSCNNLWQRVDGAIDTWNAKDHLAADLRQLQAVQPNAPRIVTEFWPGWFDRWGSNHTQEFNADWVEYRLAQILASGAQYNLYMFHGGTNFGFWGGRSVAEPACFMTTSYDYDAPLREAGGRGAKYRAVKRISTFASQFANVFAHLDPAPPHAAVHPDDTGHALSVIHQHGSQGDVVFLIKGKDDESDSVNLLLPNGLSLPVPLGDGRAHWIVLNANLGGVAKLTHTNLRPWAFAAKKMLVLFGPAGAEGIININASPCHATVPTGRTPLVVKHEGLTLVLLNHEQVDAAYLTPTGLAVGAAGLDDQGAPLPLEGWATMTTITHDGETKRVNVKPPARTAAPKLGKWTQASLSELVEGTSPLFKPIDGPASLEKLKCDYGYGWYHLKGGGSPREVRAMAPLSGDRLQFFNRGKPGAMLGLGPGAEFGPAVVRLGGDTVVLADNLGRFNFGASMGETKGLFGHLYEAKPVKLGKPQVVAGRSPDPFLLGGFMPDFRKGEEVPADVLVWKIQASNKRPLVLDILGLPWRVMVFLNNKPVGIYDKIYTAGSARFFLRVGTELKNGSNELKLALFQKHTGEDATKFVTLHEAADNLTEGMEWFFTPWTIPVAKEFGAIKAGVAGQPCWHRAEFRVTTTTEPLWLEPAGMSKGQIILNGHNVGRYFVATAEGKAVPPQERYYLPEPWLRVNGPNELLVFDEHGKGAGKCRLVYDSMGPYGE